MFFVRSFAIVLSLSTLSVKGQSPIEQDFQDLYDVIQAHITESTAVDLRPKFVRAAFHDLMNFENGKFGAEGCIFDAPVSEFRENLVRTTN